MKKRLVALALTIVMVASAMVACNKDSEKEKETTKKVTKAEIKIEKSDYVGLEVEESDATITDAELEEYIKNDLSANSKREEVKEGVLEKGMLVNIDYTGTVDGKEYASKKALEITLEQDSFAIPGFIDSLIGKSVGDEYEVTLKFPEKYEDAEYAGKDIVFKAKVNFIINTIVPELTDDYVKEVYSYLGLSTVEEYKEEYRSTIRTNDVYKVVWPEILKNVEVVSYDSEKLEALTTSISEQQELSMSQYGMTLDSYLEAASMSKDDFMKQCEESAKEELKYNMIRDYIAEAEGITITDEEYNVELKKTMVAYDMETEEEFYKYFSTYGFDKEYFKGNYLMNKVVEYICDNITVVPDKEEETTGEAETK